MPLFSSKPAALAFSLSAALAFGAPSPSTAAAAAGAARPGPATIARIVEDAERSGGAERPHRPHRPHGHERAVGTVDALRTAAPTRTARQDSALTT